MQAALASLHGKTIEVNADGAPAETTMAEVAAATAQVAKDVTVTIGANDAPLDAAVAAADAELDALGKKVVSPTISPKLDVGSLAAAAAAGRAAGTEASSLGSLLGAEMLGAAKGSTRAAILKAAAQSIGGVSATDMARAAIAAEQGKTGPSWASALVGDLGYQATIGKWRNTKTGSFASKAETAAAVASLSPSQRSSLGEDALAALIGGAAGGGGGGGILGILGAMAGGGHRSGIPGLGAVPTAAFGSLLGMMGFGAEHLIASAVGVGGSMLGAGIGGGLLGLGSAGVLGVGMGTDMAGIGQAAGDIQQYNQLTSAIAEAAAVYGKGSVEYKAAVYNYQQWAQYLNKGTIQAIAAADRTANAFHTMFDKVTADAETTGAQIIEQLMKVGMKFLPTLGRFAAENMKIIQADMQPLLHWLTGTGRWQGLGIFTNLEKIFQSELPTGMHALTQAFELFFKVMDDAAQYTGPFIGMINRLFTTLNGKDWNNGKVQKFVGDMIQSFKIWMGLVIQIIKDLSYLFKPAVGFGDALAKGLTGALKQIGDWLKSSPMKQDLHDLFGAHLQEMIHGIGDVLKALLPPAEAAVEAFMKIATAGAQVVTTVLRPMASLLHDIFGGKASGGFDQFLGWATVLGLIYSKAAPLIRAGGFFSEETATRIDMVKGALSGMAAGAIGGELIANLLHLHGALRDIAVILPTLIMGFIGVGGAEGVASLAMGVLEAAEGVLMAESLPLIATIGLIVLAVAALGFGIYELVTHWKAAMALLKTSLDDAANAMKSKWGWLLSFLGSITGIVEMADHWRQIWDTLRDSTMAVWDWMQGAWHTLTVTIPNDAANGLSEVEGIWTSAWGSVRTTADSIWSDISGTFVGWLVRIASDCATWVEHAYNNVVNWLEKLPGSAAMWLSDMWNKFATQFEKLIVEAASWSARIVTGFVREIEKLPGDAAKWLKELWSRFATQMDTLIGDATKWGKDIVEDLIRGIESMVPGLRAAVGVIGSAVKGFAHLLGIKSPSSVFYTYGQNIMKGLVNGIHSATSDVKGAIAGVGGNVTSWFTEAMKATGAPSSWLGSLETIGQHESNFNPSAINLSDINAAEGHPSQGIMQTIPSTFATYVPASLASLGIDNPVANIAAAINYIKARYGTVFNVPGIKSLAAGKGYKGYDSGGVLPPGLTAALNATGQNEYVLTGRQVGLLRGSGGAAIVHVHNNQPDIYLDGKKVGSAAWQGVRTAALRTTGRQTRNIFGTGAGAPSGTTR